MTGCRIVRRVLRQHTQTGPIGKFGADKIKIEEKRNQKTRKRNEQLSQSKWNEMKNGEKREMANKTRKFDEQARMKRKIKIGKYNETKMNEKRNELNVSE